MFDDATLKAVNFFKTKYGLGNTKPGEAGVVGPQTWGKMRELFVLKYNIVDDSTFILNKNQMGEVIQLINERIDKCLSGVSYLSGFDDTIFFFPVGGQCASIYNEMTLGKWIGAEIEELVAFKGAINHYYIDPEVKEIEITKTPYFWGSTMTVGNQKVGLLWTSPQATEYLKQIATE